MEIQLFNFILIVICINIFSFLIYGLDKYFAKKNMWRISEKALLLFALLLGAPGAYAGMQIFRHKTKKPIFYIGVPVLFIANICIIYYLFKYNLIIIK